MFQADGDVLVVTADVHLSLYVSDLFREGRKRAVFTLRTQRTQFRDRCGVGNAV